MKDIERIAETICHQLADSAGKTLLLTGPWGCGKSYLWHQRIQRRLKPRGPVYVSLFGATSATEVRSLVLDAAGVSARRSHKRLAPLNALPEGLIVCLDDVERISPRVRLHEVLGIACSLAERSAARVLMIMDDQQLSPRDAAVLGRYGEKVLTQRISASADVASMYDLNVESLAPGPAKDALLRHRRAIVDAFEATGCQNLRTLQRTIRYIKDAGAVAVDASHMRLAAALHIEYDIGNLEDADFYRFNDVSIMFRAGRHREGEFSDRERRQAAFLARYFGGAPEESYVFSAAAYDAVTRGYLSVADLTTEFTPDTAVVGVVKATLAEHNTFEAYFYSDAENIELASRSLACLAGGEAMTASEVLELASRTQIALAAAGQAVPIALADSVRVRLVRCAQGGQEDLTRVTFSFDSEYWRAFVDEYESECRRAEDQRVRQEILAAIGRADLGAFNDIVFKQPRGLAIALDPSVIGVLMASHAASRVFHYRACGLVVSELEKNSQILPDRATLRAAFRAQLVALAGTPGLDHSDQTRIGRLVAKLPEE